MALGDIAKQIAGQALKAPVKDVLDSLRPPDAGQVSEAVKNARPAAAPGRIPDKASKTSGEGDTGKVTMITNAITGARA